MHRNIDMAEKGRVVVMVMDMEEVRASVPILILWNVFEAFA